METDEAQRLLPFQLQFDKPVASQIKIAEWNPEKDLLAMATEDSKILLHRFNWQRLWTISPGKSITSLCWRPDGKAIAVGLEDGTISLHDVESRVLRNGYYSSCSPLKSNRTTGEFHMFCYDAFGLLHQNGKLLRSLKSHAVAVVCLNWEEDGQFTKNESGDISTYEDRTSRFFPPAPRIPRMPGLVAGDTGFMDDSEDSFLELSSSSHQRFNILCSGDKDGSICFNIFGIFPIGKINIQNLCVCTPLMDDQATYRLLNASICKVWDEMILYLSNTTILESLKEYFGQRVSMVFYQGPAVGLIYKLISAELFFILQVALSKDFCHLIVMCSGLLNQEDYELREKQIGDHDMQGLHCLVLNSSIFSKRKNELHQMAQQASNIEDLMEVIRASLTVMCKQWSDAMHTFHEKFDSLSSLIVDHGLDRSPQEEFLSLLGGAQTSPPIHQFLVNSLGEVGVKRVSKAVCGAGKELQSIVLDHLQPAAEIIGFRMGELRGLSRWRARYQGIGLDEPLINHATEKSGMFLVQVERFMMVLSSVVQQFSNFFDWLLKCIKLLMQEPSDQLPRYNSELVVIFLKFLYDQDPVRQLLEPSEVDRDVEVDLETMQRVRELVQFGGFSDCNFLQKTLFKEFQQMELSFKEAFLMPFATISKKILCEELLPLFPLPSSSTPVSISVPMSVSYYENASQSYQTSYHGFIDYVSFRIPDEPFSDIANCIGIARGVMHDLSNVEGGDTSLEVVLLSVPTGYHCVDLSLYKESQLVLLLNETSTSSESSGEACMMIVQASDLPFVSISRLTCLNHWELHQLRDSVVYLQMENEKVRSIPHSVIAPLAVSASRGVACVFAAKKRVLVYILDEDEDEVSDTE